MTPFSLPYYAHGLLRLATPVTGETNNLIGSQNNLQMNYSCPTFNSVRQLGLV